MHVQTAEDDDVGSDMAADIRLFLTEIFIDQYASRMKVISGSDD